MAIQLPYTGGTTDETLPTPYTNGGGSIDLTLKEDKANKGVANGYAPLDANSKVPTANLPDQAALDAEVDGKITTHNSATTSVHGIANTANLVLTNDSRLADSRTPTAHSHAISDVTNLQTTLDGKQASGSYAPATGISPTAITGTAVITTDSRLSDSRTPTTHTHTPSDITNLFAVVGGGIATINWSAGSHFAGTLSGNTNIAFQNVVAGKSITVAITGNTGFGVNWPAGTSWLSNSAPAITDGQTTYFRILATTSNTFIGEGFNGRIGFTSNLPLITTTGGAITTGSFGTTANSFCQGNDSRLSDNRTPTSHSHSISEVTSLQATLTAFAIALG